MFYIIGLIICGLVLIVCVFGFIGAGVNCDITCDLVDAIGAYKRKCIRDNEWDKFTSVDYDDIYDFNMIQDCFPWLWRYEKHLPPEKFEIIEPFLSKKK